MWDDSLIWVSYHWLIDTRRDTLICKDDTFTCDTTHSCATWVFHTWHDSFMRDTTHSWFHEPIHMWYDSFPCDTTHSCAHMNASCHIYKEVTPHMNESFHVWMRHVTYIHKSCYIHTNPFICGVKLHIHESYHSWVIWSISHVIPTNSSINPHALWKHHAVKRLSAHDSFIPWVISLMDDSRHTHKLIIKT